MRNVRDFFKKKEGKKQEQNYKELNGNTYVPIKNIFNVYGLNAPIKRYRLAERIRKEDT